MKKHLFFLAVLFLAYSSIGQTTVDLRVTFIQPVNDQNLEAGQVYVAMVNVENEGPDPFHTYDTLMLEVTFSGVPTPNPIYITGQVIPPFGEIPISQQIGFDESWIGNSAALCIRIIPLNANISLTDPDTSNNEDCINVHIVDDVTGATELTGNDFGVFPVPATDFIQLKTTEKVQRIRAIDASGKVTTLDWNGTSADCRSLSNGFYLLQVETEDKTMYQRVVVSH